MFSKSNPFDEIVASATDENLTSENWELILGVCDRVTRSTPENARDCVTAITKRFTSRNANVQLYALTLSEALVKNCDITVHREISSRMFTTALTKLIHDKTTHESVRKRALELIQTCSFEFRNDPSLGLMNEVYHSLRAEGIQFPNPQKPKKEYTQSELDKQKEEEELQLALALSLSESENRSTYRPSSYTPKASTATATTSTSNVSKPKDEPAPKVSRVRALYDFQPTEQGELGFQKGDIIRVIESVYRDWWKGELRGQVGIFPVNYVEKIVDPSPADLMKEAQMEAEVMAELQNIDRLLDMLSRIDPQKDSFSENEELQNLYNSTLSIRPKLVRLIEKYSLKKDELVALNEKFLQARTMYDRMLGTSIARYTSPTVHNGYVHTQPYGMYDPQTAQQQQQPSFPQMQPQPYPPQVIPQQQQQQPYTAPPSTETYHGYQQQPYSPHGYVPQPSPAPVHQQQPQQPQPQQPQVLPQAQPQQQQQQMPPAYTYPDSQQQQQQPAQQQPQPLQYSQHDLSSQPQQQAAAPVAYEQQQQHSQPYPVTTSSPAVVGYPLQPQPQQQPASYPYTPQPEQPQNYPFPPATPQQQHQTSPSYMTTPQPYPGANQAYAQNY